MFDRISCYEHMQGSFGTDAAGAADRVVSFAQQKERFVEYLTVNTGLYGFFPEFFVRTLFILIEDHAKHRNVGVCAESEWIFQIDHELGRTFILEKLDHLVIQDVTIWFSFEASVSETVDDLTIYFLMDEHQVIVFRGGSYHRGIIDRQQEFVPWVHCNFDDGSIAAVFAGNRKSDGYPVVVRIDAVIGFRLYFLQENSRYRVIFSDGKVCDGTCFIPSAHGLSPFCLVSAFFVELFVAGSGQLIFYGGVFIWYAVKPHTLVRGYKVY